MDNGLLTDSEMAKVFNYGMMVLFMWAIGKMIKQMVKADLFMLMVMFMKEIG